ncbi:MAG TPA: hypothetical protein VFS00_24795, partial [Polyangiaceae bacterium]|nr:hypothetical protein [Polyangiaceae bacterium]
MHPNSSSLRRSLSATRRAVAAPGALLATCLALGCGADAAPAAEPSALQKAVLALGGPAALGAVRALSFEGEGTSLVVDEGVAAGDPSRAVSEYRVAVDVDLEGGNLSVAYERESLAMVPGAKTTYREIAAGGGGYLLGNELVFG